MMNVEGTAVEREIGKTLMPLMHAFFSFGTVLGAGIGAAAAALHIAVAWHLAVIAVLMVAVALFAIRFIPREAELGDETEAQPRMPFGQRLRASLAVWADWRLILIGVVMLGMAFGEGSANDWIALATVDGHGQQNSTGAVVFGFFVAAMTVGRVLGGPVVDRIGRVTAIRVTAAMGVAGLLLFILGGPLCGQDNPAARVSAVAIIGYCAFLVGPPLIGFLGKEFGILNALYLILVLLVASFLAAPAVRPVAERRARAATPATE